MEYEYEDNGAEWNSTAVFSTKLQSIFSAITDKCSDDGDGTPSVVIASDSSGGSSSTLENPFSGSFGTRNRVAMTDNVQDNHYNNSSSDHHVIKSDHYEYDDGSSSEDDLSTTTKHTLRCDRIVKSDTLRLKMSPPQEEGSPFRCNGVSLRRSIRNKGNILLLAYLSVFLLTGQVAFVCGKGANNNNNYGDDGRTGSNVQDNLENTWNQDISNNNNQQQESSPRYGSLKGFNVMEDINLLDEQGDLIPLSGNNVMGNEEDDPGNKEHYTHQWAVHILGGPEVARRVAEKHGFDFHGEILQDYYHLTHSRVAKRSIERHSEYHERLASEPQVRWLKQQTVKSRKKRDFLPEPIALTSSGNSGSGNGGGGGKSGRRRAARRSKTIVLNDPRWPAMWYLNRGGGLDMNVLEAWNEGITGKGIVVTILDDGLEKDHPDIVRNYDPMASFDVNSLDMDPMPTYDLTDSNRHGTRCAGEVAAEANNSICAVGIAFEAGVGGVRMLDGDVTDAVEARSLSHNPQHIDIYSASWGPDDDGKTVDGPGELATRAFIEGVTKGRNGKGSIFVWASGNGGRDHDNCNCDGYTNSIWTLSISSATENGFVPWYSEACSSTLATTYSSGGTGEKQIVTIDLHHSCTSSHTGTSASAPLAAGICALALQANTNLTWRDMQHIVVRTARPQHLIANDWATNGVGRNVSHSFGYGLMDAGSMVKLAKKWKTVPDQHKCEIKAPYTDKNIPSKSKVTLDLKVTNCPNVNYLEHVQAKVTLTSGRRGDLQIFLVSPAGTRSQLLAHRRHDLNRAGFTDWPFMTVHSWGESPIGKWTLEIHNEGRYTGKMQTWSLIAHGISSNPNDLVDGSGIGGGGGSFIGGAGSQKDGHIREGESAAATAVVERFDGSDNTIGAAEGSSSSLQNNGVPLPANAGVAKPVSIVGRPSSPSSAGSSSAASTAANCAKMSAQGQCLECASGLALLHNGCVSQCPDTFYVESRGHPSLQPESEGSANSIHYLCLPCHYSCQTCSGPNDDECVTCHGDANLHRISVESDPATTTDKAHCYPKELMNTLDKSDLSHRVLLAIIAVSVVFILCLFLVLCCDCCKMRRSGTNGTFKEGYEHSQEPGWLRNSRLAMNRPYKRISPEEFDDDDEEYEYYDAHRDLKGRMGGRVHGNQTHLELISEDEEVDDETEQLVPSNHNSNNSYRGQFSVDERNITDEDLKKVPIIVQSHSFSSPPSRGVNSNISSSSNSSRNNLGSNNSISIDKNSQNEPLV